MLNLVEAEVRQQIDQRLAAQGWVLDPQAANRDVFIERSVVRHLSTIQRRRLEGLSPDYVFFSESVPIAVLEAKKPNVSIDKAFEQGADYADRIGCEFVFACNGPTFKSLHTPSGGPMFLNNLEVNEPLAPTRLRKFWQERSNSVMTVPHQVIESRAQLIEVFEVLNNVLRQAGIRAGLERFTEFSNILFLKLLSERDTEDQTWSDLLGKPDKDLPDYLNRFVVDRLKSRYQSDVLSQSRINGTALKRIIQELNPLHLMSVDEDLKGVAFEHFLSRTTAINNDLGEYFTPRSVVRFMIQLLNPQFGETVYDPFCGTGGFLIEAFRHLGQQARPSADAMRVLHHESVCGRELTTTARVAKMNMILFGDGHSGVNQGNSLVPANEAHDCVLSNIPFSLEVDADVITAVDAGAQDADEACLLHCFNSLKQGGSMAIVVPEGLVVNQDHSALWKRIFKGSRVRVIAALPRGTFSPYTEAGTNILYLTDKGTKETEWYYRAAIAGEKARGETIGTDEFLFFYRDADEPIEHAPSGVEVVRIDGRREWNIASGSDVVLLEEVASIDNGKMITKAYSTPGSIPVIAGGRVPAYTHNEANTQGHCFTISKSGAYSGYVWWHEYPIWASDCMVVRSLDEEEYMTFYLFLCMKAKQEEIYGRQQGTGQPHVYRKHIVDFPIPKLSLAEQWDKVNEAQELSRQRVDIGAQQTAALEESVTAMSAAYAGDAMKRKTKPLPADYKGASPRQVAEALLRYRRGKAPRKLHRKPGTTKG